MGNNNDNAFRFRKLFQMYDSKKTGSVRQGQGLGQGGRGRGRGREVG